MSLAQALTAAQIAATVGGTAMSYKQQSDARKDSKEAIKQAQEAEQELARRRMEVYVTDRKNQISKIQDAYKKAGKPVPEMKVPQMPSADYVFTTADLVDLGVTPKSAGAQPTKIDYGSLASGAGAALGGIASASAKNDPNKELKEQVNELKLSKEKEQLESALKQAGKQLPSEKSTLWDQLWGAEKTSAPVKAEASALNNTAKPEVGAPNPILEKFAVKETSSPYGNAGAFKFGMEDKEEETV